MLYRVQQFTKAITAIVTQEEVEWVKAYLSEAEQTLFFKLRIYEQRHCIDVAKILEEYSQEQSELIRLGLLHDIGKIKYPLNPIEKSIIVLLNKLTKGKIKKCHGLKMVKCYYEHAEIGYQMLKQIGSYEASFLECVKNHHRQELQDVKLNLLQQADNLC